MYDLCQFLQLSQDITHAGATGNEWFPEEFLNPTQRDIVLLKDVHNLLVAYYNAAYEECNFCAVIKGKHASGTIVANIAMQHRRMCISAKVFGLMLSSRHHASPSFSQNLLAVKMGRLINTPGKFNIILNMCKKLVRRQHTTILPMSSGIIQHQPRAANTITHSMM